MDTKPILRNFSVPAKRRDAFFFHRWINAEFAAVGEARRQVIIGGIRLQHHERMR